MPYRTQFHKDRVCLRFVCSALSGRFFYSERTHENRRYFRYPYPSRRSVPSCGGFRIFKDVDLILHAGDIVQLSVLEELRTIAPVEAVAGNMDEDEVQQRASAEEGPAARQVHGRPDPRQIQDRHAEGDDPEGVRRRWISSSTVIRTLLSGERGRRPFPEPRKPYGQTLCSVQLGRAARRERRYLTAEIIRIA